MKGRFLTLSFHTLVFQVGNILFSGLLAIMAARFLGPENRGTYAQLLMLPTLFVVFGRFGLTHACNFFSGKVREPQLIANSIFLSFVIVVGLLVILFPSVSLVNKYFLKGVDPKLIFLVVCGAPLFLLHSHFIGLFQSLFEIRLRNFLSFAQIVTEAALFFIFLNFFSMGVRGGVIASLASVGGAFVLETFLLFRRMRRVTWTLEPLLMKSLLGFGLKSHVGNILKDLSYRLDVLILGLFLPSRDIGFYVVAVTVTEVLWVIPDAVGLVLLPRVARMTKDESRRFTPLVNMVVTVTALLVAAGMYGISGFFLPLVFGKDYTPALSALWILIPGALFMVVWKILANDLLGRGHPVGYSVSSAVSLIVMVVFDFILAPHYGIRGAAVASSLSYLCATVVIVVAYIKTTGLATRDLFNLSQGWVGLRALLSRGSFR